MRFGFDRPSVDQLAGLHSAPLRYLVPLSLGVEYNETPMGISRLGQAVSETKIFEIVDDDDGAWVYYKLTCEPSAQAHRSAKKKHTAAVYFRYTCSTISLIQFKTRISM